MQSVASAMRNEVTSALDASRMRLGAGVMAAVVVALLGLGLASTAAAQSSGLGAGGLNLEPSSGGVSSDNGPNSLQAIAGPTAGGTPKAEASEKIYDFGSVLNADSVAHVFKIRNAGTGTLLIKGVQTSCGCTAAKPTKNAVAPGEESDIGVSFDTRFDKGPATRTITVYTNDPKAQQIVLTIKGDVKVQVEAAPAQVAFGDVKHGTAQMRQVLLTDLVAEQAAGSQKDSKNAAAFKVQSTTNASPNIKVEAVARNDGKPGAELTIALLKTMPLGPFDDTIKVATSRAPVDITVFGTVQGDITVKPPQVSFGIVPHHQGTLRMARLVNAGGRAMRVIGVSSSNGSVSATVEPITPGKEYKVTLALQPNTPDGALRGQVAITTDDPDQHTVSLPYYGIIGSFRG